MVENVAANIDLISLVRQVFFILGTVLVLAVLAGAGYFMYRYLDRLAKYKYNIDIIEQVGESNFGRSDIGRELKEEGKYFVELLKTRTASGKRVRVAMPDPRYLIPFGIRKKLFLSNVGGLYTAMPVVRNSPAMFKFDFDNLLSVLRWREQDHIRALETYAEPQSFWLRNQQVILFSTAMIILLVMAFVIIWQLQNLEIVVNTQQIIT